MQTTTVSIKVELCAPKSDCNATLTFAFKGEELSSA